MEKKVLAIRSDVTSDVSPAITKLVREIVGDFCEPMYGRNKISLSNKLVAVLLDSGFPSQYIGGRENQLNFQTALGTDGAKALMERANNAGDSLAKVVSVELGIKQSPLEIAKYLNSGEACAFVPVKELRAVFKDWDKRNCPYLPTIAFCMDEISYKHPYLREESDISVLIADRGVGIPLTEMPNTILDIGSSSKLRDKTSLGKYGMGGSLAFAFCSSSLIITKNRYRVNEQGEILYGENNKPLLDNANTFSVAVVYDEPISGDSKQKVAKKWFYDPATNLPFSFSLNDFPELKKFLPGTMVFHFGYQRGNWLKNNQHVGHGTQLGIFRTERFSYPIPFKYQAHWNFKEKVANRCRSTYNIMPGNYFNLENNYHKSPELQDDGVRKVRSRVVIESLAEKRGEVIVDGINYGFITLKAWVLKNHEDLESYCDTTKPVILTLYGMTHGMINNNLICFDHLRERMIVEIKLDNLDNSALDEIIRPSRDIPHQSKAVAEIKRVATIALAEDTVLRSLEEKFCRERVKSVMSTATNSIKKAVSGILRHIYTGLNIFGSGRQGFTGKQDGRQVRKVMEENDPPAILTFEKDVVYIHDFAKNTDLLNKKESSDEREVRAVFCTDARSNRYRFEELGNIPVNIKAKYEPITEEGKRIHISGHGEIDRRGWGYVRLTRDETMIPVDIMQVVGKLTLTMLASDGSKLSDTLKVGLHPMRRGLPNISVHYQAEQIEEEGDDKNSDKIRYTREKIAELLGISDKEIEEIDSDLTQQATALNLPLSDTAYTCKKVVDSKTSSEYMLAVRINVGNAELLRNLARLTGEHRATYFRDYVVDLCVDGFLTQFDMEAFSSEKKNAALNAIKKEVLDSDTDNRSLHLNAFWNHLKSLEVLNRNASENMLKEKKEKKQKANDD